MALWPFGRKKRKGNRGDEKGENDEEELGITTQKIGPQGPAATARSIRESRASKASSIKPASSRKLSKTRDASLPPPPVPPVPRPQSPDVAQLNEKGGEQVEAQPESFRLPLSELINTEEAAPDPPFAKEQRSTSQSSIQPENFTAVAPTLKSRKSAYYDDVSRNKSSKRKADTRAREQEIRSMSSPIPIPKRPRSYTTGLLARDSQNFPGGLNRKLERPRSEVSLPYAESLQSDASSEMHQSFRVSAFDALSPRPTIRYSDSPRRMAGSPLGPSLGPSRNSTRKEKAPAIPEEDFGPRARINDLADEMDATALRELMDRDRRRRDRKKKKDQVKLEQKLQRRLEKQQAEASGTHDSSGDVKMRDAGDVGVGPGESSKAAPAAQPSAADRPALNTSESWPGDASKEDLSAAPEDPFNDQTHLDLGTDDEREEAVVSTAQAVQLSTASMSPPSSPVLQQQHMQRGPSGLSVMTSASPTSASHVRLGDIPEPPGPDRLHPVEPRRDSETSARAGTSWTSFFRRSGTRGPRDSPDKGRNTPSEFSNTSRESFVRSNKLPPPPPLQRSFKPKNSAPQRTKSKFKEDLPELPLSPPASRLQSPDRPETPVSPMSPRSPTSPTSPYIDHTSKVKELDEQARASTPIGDVHPAFRDEVAMSIGQSPQSETLERPSLLSQSLASVDSEGSWLSGRPAKRSSFPIDSIDSLRDSNVSVAEQTQGGKAAEPDFARRDPNPAQPQGRSGLTSQLRPAEPVNVDNDDMYAREPAPVSPFEDSPKIATVHGGKPKLVQRSPAFKSREGLLDEFNAGEGESVSEPSPDTPTEHPQVQQLGAQAVSVLRATSIEYGKGHTRTVSAGSARLLDIPARSSTEQKRMSGNSGISKRSSLSHAPGQEMGEENGKGSAAATAAVAAAVAPARQNLDLKTAD